jgi:hypothetical protein
MSLVESRVRETPKEIRRRLFKPAGGRDSSELEVVAEHVAKRQREAEEARTRDEAEKRRRQDEANQATAAAALRKASQEDEIRERDRRIADLVEQISRSETELKTLCSEALRECPRDYSFQGKFPQVLDVISKFYFVHTIHIVSQQRTALICRARHLVMWFAYHVTGMSLSQIGRRLGGRDHTTVLSGLRKIQRQVDAGEARTVLEISDIKKRLGVE